jgi:hypothetical protein
MDWLIDNSAAKLGIAEATFNNAHRNLVRMESQLKMGQPWEEARVTYELLKSNVEAIPGNYADAAADPWPGAEERAPVYVEVEEG